MYCRRCGATLHQGVVICPECGARQRRGISSVRCARCGHRVSLGLTVCPHCGRDVHPAGPRWGLWLAGFAVIAVTALWGLGELPVDRISTEVASMRTRVARVVQFLGPVATAAPEPTRRPTVQAVAAARNTPTPTPTEMPFPEGAASETEPGMEATVTVTATLTTPEPTPALNSPALTATPTATLEPTATPSPQPTATPTLEPTVTPTAAPTQTSAPSGRVTYIVKPGDTLSSIATKYGISWQALAEANKLTSRSTLRIGQELVIPVPGSQPAAAPAATAASDAVVKYAVKSGDSLSSIASRYGITWQELAAANGLTAQSRLNVGQQLIIPGKGAVLPTSTGAPVRTATPEPTPAPTEVPLLAVPEITNPADQASYRGAKTEIYLMWKPVANVPAGAGYRVVIQWTEQGAPMEYLVPVTTATSIRMPAWLFQRADQPTRKYAWNVRVVQTATDGQGSEKDILLSPSSEQRVLYWY